MRRITAFILAAALLWSSMAAFAEPLTPLDQRRGADQTFLTFPEWYLVHSPAEYAHFLGYSTHPSEFPLFAHIGQFWQGYAAVCREIQKFPFNGGYHLMVMVIGTSTTLEYSLKGIYEHTIGRLGEATRSGITLVPEERFAGRYAQAYVDFIRIDPWYMFDFAAQLKTLWSDFPIQGPNLLRRWERRFALTSELVAKTIYGKLIKLATHSIYDAPKPVSAVILSKAPQPNPIYSEVKTLPGSFGNAVGATIPRYEAFTRYSLWLAANGIEFKEIAGNSGDVVVSVLAGNNWSPQANAVRVLFAQPIITQPGRRRFVLAMPVPELSNQLRAIGQESNSISVEHVYDF